MNVELKSVKVYDKLSEETICFTATIVINGKKVGEAKNDGHGGCTHYRFFDEKIGEEFETYAKSLPDPDYPSDSMNGEYLIGKLLDDWLKVDDAKKEQKRLVKLDAKYKADAASKGFSILRVNLEGSYAWLSFKGNQEQAELSVSNYEAKKNVKAKSWHIL